MNRSQKRIVVLLSFVACAFLSALGYYGFNTYQEFMNKPLGASAPQFPDPSMPATWTPTVGGPLGVVTYAPTISFDSTATPRPICGGVGVMNVLAVGADSRSDTYEYGLADVIRLVRVDFSNQKVAVLEFPRDLWVEIPYIADNINGQDHEKLNQAYLYGQPGDGFAYWDDPSRGPGLLALTMDINFGVKTDHYISVNMRTFVNVVNAVGGIEINIPNEEYADSTGLDVGKHHLNGDQALKVARNREESTFARVDNQNLVLCSVRKKIASPEVVTQIPELIASFQDNIFTDMTPQQLSQLACLGTKIKPENITFASFPEELFKESRIMDPVFDKRVFVWDVDFNILRDYVAQFQAGTWPNNSPSIESAEEDSVGVVCE
ncbi:MAG: LCP family protein [Anaerolineales bacterium]|nr:LCP family protein [Anaerolineales bacterium]